jgi:5-methyltetrahydrofolate--homocysteine methyltransferase
LRDAAERTLIAIGKIKAEMPGVFTVLGLSNVSFGLPGPARKMLNSVFLHEAVEAGMDGAIVSAGKILPLARVPEDARELCLDLIYDRVKEEGKTPLMALIDHFQHASEESDSGDDKEFELPETTLFRKVVDGDKEGLDDVLSMLLLRRSALSIINDVLVPAMRQVGELFGAGEILLPFVLMSAEVMKRAVSHLEPFMPKQTEGGRTKILLATVQGDVHDIGKNLVEIILANNGYHVVNIGIKVPAETIIEQAREHKVDIIGLSGLLVKSALVMKDNMTIFQEAGLDIPVLLGGAALTRRFVAEDCAPHYDAPVVYCPDAFSGLAAVRAFEAGTLTSTVWESEGVAKAKPGRKEAKVSRDNPVPKAPFLGARHVVDIDPRELLPYMNVQALFRGRWGYRRGKMSAEEYEELIATKVQPMYDRLVERSVTEKLVTPRVAYGYYRCFSRDNSVFVAHEDRLLEFAFPRQENEPNLCIADYFKSEAEGGDIVSFFVVTIGERLGQETAKLFAEDAYHDYLVTHGYGTEITDALAEYWHEVMRREMGIDKQSPDEQLGYVVQDYQGSRYGFGYPACPDLGAHKLIFDLLRPEEIGVSLSDTMQMVPEQTTSAMIAHHPQAKYFAV